MSIWSDLTAHIKHRHKQNEAHAQGLQIVLEGIEGGAPQQTPAAQPPPQATTQIQSGTSGWSPGGGGGQAGYQRGYAYGERFLTFFSKMVDNSNRTCTLKM